jgi:uncharacterized protein YecE (DUF72 family)
MSGKIRVGIGGWDFEPWRGAFFPPGLAKTKQLAFVGEHLTATEINATYYGSQRPETFRKWEATVPADFRFAVKASRFCTNRRILGEAKESVEKFCTQGIVELGDKLGPILWQFAPTKKFDREDFALFLKLLPERQGGLRLRHALEVRHESFVDPAFVALARDHNAAIVYADHETYPKIDEWTADFAYARLQLCREEEGTGYNSGELDQWAKEAKGWAANGRETFVFFISGAKVRAPAAAEALIARL